MAAAPPGAVPVRLQQETSLMAKKLSIGTWAYAFGPYQQNPIPFDTVVRGVARLGFDGVEIAGCRPHIHPDDYPMKADRDRVRALLAVNQLGVSGLAADLWSTPGPGTDAAQENDTYIKAFKKNVQLCMDVGSPAIRVDTVDGPDGPKGVDYKLAVSRIASLWHECAQIAEEFSVRVVWEFEPGFFLNKPSEVVKMYEDVDHPNFSIMLDTCHAHMCAVVGARQPGKKETLKGGVLEFIEMLRGKIGHIHLIDSDETLHDNETSTHAPFGTGVIDFDQVIPAIHEAGFVGPWWTVDLCFWPNAWDVTASSREFLKKYIDAY
jgi:sugar phosphate isomerase/epimerase